LIFIFVLEKLSPHKHISKFAVALIRGNASIKKEAVL